MSDAERMPTWEELERTALENVEKLEPAAMNSRETALATMCTALVIMVFKLRRTAEIALAVACGAVGGLIVLAVRLAMK